jgi:hypothetical protein
MASKIELKLETRLSADRVLHHFKHGLAYGGLLGPGLVIDSLEANGISFSSTGLPSPQQGKLELSELQGGGTKIRLELACHNLRRTQFFKAALAGGFIGFLALLGFGWLITISAPLSVAVALLVDQIGWRQRRRGIAIEATNFVRNFELMEQLVEEVGKPTND